MDQAVPTESSTLGDRLKWARIRAGFSARELDRAAGKTEGHATAIENGTMPRADTLDAYAGALGFDAAGLAWLIRGTGAPPSPKQRGTAAEPVHGASGEVRTSDLTAALAAGTAVVA